LAIILSRVRLLQVDSNPLSTGLFFLFLRKNDLFCRRNKKNGILRKVTALTLFIFKMDELESRLHRTWVASLVEFNFPELAAIAIDFKVRLIEDSFDTFNGEYIFVDYIVIDMPIPSYQISQDNIDLIKKTLLGICHGHIPIRSGNYFDRNENELNIVFRIALLDIEEDWQKITRRLIVESRNPNQGVITEKVFGRRGRNILEYNEMKFGSKSEIRIAQELEERKVLFFPLPLAVCKETGEFYKDHREPDFLICDNGSWGILEVAYHPDRFEEDQQKLAWFKELGILCIECYPAERCYNNPKQVVDEFMRRLDQHRR
jgi:hypothetical protein